MGGKVLNHLGETKLELGPVEKTRAKGARGHWRYASDDGDIGWLVLDRKDASANTLSEAVLKELDKHLAAIEKAPPRALVIRSAKPAGFIAGADITEFRGVGDRDQITEKLRAGHAVFDRLEKLTIPTIAVIHGYCLGGGFELALSCDYRIAIDGAYFGFPEVRLGLHPGLGGTFRLTGLIDPVEAMTMMLTGKNAYTKKAKSLGIADLVTLERHLARAIADIAEGGVDKHEQGLKGSAFSLKPARGFAARQMRSRTGAKAPKAHYPAPHALIDLWEEYGGEKEAMQQGEIRSFAELLAGETAQNLIRVFFLREKLKEGASGEHDIRHVHVIGAGTMGGEIAAWCAIRGFRVTLGDIAAEPLGEAVKAAGRIADDAHLSAIEKRDALDRLIPDLAGTGVAKADLVIEAAPERPDLKRRIYADIEPRLKDDAILATNTSSLKLDGLVKSLKKPGRFAGLHFFNPVSKMQLVEIVRHDKTGKTTQTRLAGFCGAIDRLPAPVRSYPGFLVNRTLTPYLMEAILLLDEGIAKEVIDRAAERFGMPAGPIELADQVGLDICLHVAESLRDNLEKPMPEIPDWLRRKVEEGELGRKTGRGFYRWQEGKPQEDDADEETLKARGEEITDRLILPMLDACVECLRRDVVADTETIDGAMIFATGFAPFTGGPMHYAKNRGVEAIRQRLEELADAHGPRFAPDKGWSKLA